MAPEGGFMKLPYPLTDYLRRLFWLVLMVIPLVGSWYLSNIIGLFLNAFFIGVLISEYSDIYEWESHVFMLGLYTVATLLPFTIFTMLRTFTEPLYYYTSWFALGVSIFAGLVWLVLVWSFW